MDPNLVIQSQKKDSLDGKDYYRPTPRSTVFRDWRVDKVSPNVEDADSIEEFSDYVFGADACTFVIGKNAESETDNPNQWSFPVGNHKPFSRGHTIIVDTIDGKSAVRTIAYVDRRHRTIVLRTPLTHLPKLGGDVIRILGESTDAINRKKTEKANKEEIKLMGGRWV